MPRNISPTVTRGCAAYPVGNRRAREMLAFFILEKAMQDICDDLANRPGRVGVRIREDIEVLNKGRAGAGNRGA
jgi:hypothetical protein